MTSVSGPLLMIGKPQLDSSGKVIAHVEAWVPEDPECEWPAGGLPSGRWVSYELPFVQVVQEVGAACVVTWEPEEVAA